MKSIKIPDNLLSLPKPWAFTYSEKREAQLTMLEANITEFKNAIEAIEICINTVSQIKSSEEHFFFKKYDQQIWYIYESISMKILFFQNFNLIIISDFLKSLDIESTPELVNLVALAWLQNRINCISDDAVNWISNNFKKRNDERIIKTYLHMAEKCWHISDGYLQRLLLITAVYICGEKAHPLLDLIINDPNVAKSIQEAARDYKNYKSIL